MKAPRCLDRRPLPLLRTEAMRVLCRGMIWMSLWTATALSAGAQVEIHHLGNEGFLLQSAEHAVLVDALFGEGLTGYPVVPKAIRQDIEAARGVYAEVDLVLASHIHADHFDPDAVARHLRANPEAHFVSTRQAAKALRTTGIDTERIHGFWPSKEQRPGLAHRGVHVRALRFHHGNSTQNLGLLFDLGGLSILHLGDSIITPEEQTELPMDDIRIDIVMAPYWMLDSSRGRRVLDQLNARHVIAMHFPSADAPDNYFGERKDLPGQVKACQNALPDAWMAYRTGTSRTYSPSTS